jgi:hypothetical protein
VTYEGAVISRIMDGRITERWGTVDLFGILSRLGSSTTLRTCADPDTVSVSS